MLSFMAEEAGEGEGRGGVGARPWRIRAPPSSPQREPKVARKSILRRDPATPTAIHGLGPLVLLLLLLLLLLTRSEEEERKGGGGFKEGERSGGR